MADKIITIESVDDDEYAGKTFKKVMSTEGLYYNVKQGREGSLKAKWELLKPGATIKLIFGEFKGKKYVQDIELATEEEVGEQGSPIESPNLTSKELNTLIMAAKDLWIADKLPSAAPEVKALRHLMCLRFAAPEPVPNTQNPVVAEAIKMGARINQPPDGPLPRDPHSLKTLGELFMAIYKDFKLTKTQALKAWGYESQEKIKDIPGCYQFIASLKESEQEENNG